MKRLAHPQFFIILSGLGGMFLKNPVLLKKLGGKFGESIDREGNIK
jgi:hypothetical protein